MVTLEQLRQLVAVADCGTLSGAAERLLLSQPALSRSMQRLEREFPLPLFERAPNRVELTEAGALVVADARRVLDQVQAMYDAAREHERRQRSVEVISCAPAPLWELLPRLEQACPGMAVTTRVTGQAAIDEAVRAGDFQLAVTTRRPRTGEGFRCGNEQLFVSLAADDELAGRSGVLLDELDGRTMLLAPELGFWGELVHRRMPGATFLVQDDAAWRQIAGASTLPVFTTDRSQRAQQLPGRVLVPVQDPEAHPTYWCLVHPDQRRRLAALLAGGVLPDGPDPRRHHG